jgi:hypothetical protein
MSTQHARPWPAVDVAELRYGLAFGSSVEEIANFLRRDVDDVAILLRCPIFFWLRATERPL